jgi:uncharacterized protein (TIGR00255 family)
MTGFGRARGVVSRRFAVSVVIRSVNHRYLDVQVRSSLRDELPEVEAAVREAVSEPLERGRVTVQVDFERTEFAESRVVVNSEAVVTMLHQLRDLDLPEGVEGGVSLRDVLAVPGLVAVSGAQIVLDEDEMAGVAAIAREALEQLLTMRRDEGARLGDQIRSEVDRIAGFLAWLEPRLPTFQESALVRLRERVSRLLGGETALDPERLHQEAALLADRGDISEEVVRLHSHLEAFRLRIRQCEAIGRTLDFLCQEILRELNTIGSKCREEGVAEHLIDAKAAVERLREQVQNVE